MLGVDIGGTKTAFGFVTKEGQVISSEKILTKAEEHPKNLFSRLHNSVHDLLLKLPAHFALKGIGVGAPNANYLTGMMENPPNLSWGTLPVNDLMTSLFKLPCVLTNDAKAAALGEKLFGAARGMKNFIVITIGTGLGSGIVVNSELVYGHSGFAGEIGHTIYDPNGRVCGCGRRGCLETYASASGIKRTVYELIADLKLESTLRKFSYEELTSKMISEEAHKGDALALEAFDYTAKILGLKLADSVAHLCPEAIFLCGGLAQAGELLFKPLRKYLEDSLLSVFKNKVMLAPSLLPAGQSAILGAGALAWMHSSISGGDVPPSPDLGSLSKSISKEGITTSQVSSRIC